MRRWLARSALALIAIGVLVASAFIHVSVTSSMWPFYSGHNPRLLAFIGGVVVWVIVVVAGIAAIVITLIALWDEATK